MANKPTPKTTEKPPKFSLAKQLQKADAGAAAMLEQTREEAAQHERRLRSVLPLKDIRPRAQGDTRPLKLAHVQAIAESLPVQGLLQPVVIDRLSHLLAGGHRLAAVTLLGVAVGKVDPSALLAQPFLRPATTDEAVLAAVEGLKANRSEEELVLAWRQHFEQGVPVRVLEIDSTAQDEVQIAKAIEMIENAQRLNYTAAEMKTIVEDYRSRGYVETAGRPKAGTKALAPALEVVFGVSYSTVRRLLERDPKRTKPNRSSAPVSFDQVMAWVGACRSVEQLEQVAEAAASSLMSARG